ncbi:MAG TPA: CdaR family protein [Bryobacteraceae bacterium]|jgi:YbbR domain-containing protein|nr:CdaR family protein [Bryobacteraceae bacterium]
MIEALTRNAGWKLFSLAVSLMLWFAYARDPEIGTFVSVPVEYRGMPDDLEISSDLVGSVSIDLRGPANKIENFNSAKSAVVLDFSDIHKPGERTFQIDEHNTNLPTGMRLVRAIPAQIRLQFEQRTRLSVPVQVRFSGALPKGYHVARYEAKPKELTILGPASHVKKIEYAVTDPIDVAAVVGESQFHVNAYVGDPHVRFEKPVRISVTVFMEKHP